MVPKFSVKDRPIKTFFVFCLMGVLAACAGKPHILVDYSLPEAKKPASGQAVHFVFQDQRGRTTYLSPEARSELKDYKGYFLLVLSSEDKPDQHLGTKTLEALFLDALEHRALRAGFSVQPSPGKGASTVEVRLQVFRLELVEKKWTVAIEYTMSAALPEGRFADRRVSATGERLKLLGKKELEKLLGDVFSDAINKADIAGLLDGAIRR